ncbi:hypothetical protein N7516_006724 [Penicillium verrucosum]|uniref:uncharacterized protein n=1 Tax=Penicillium verrucosum TaxID=60171 RepID=UPI00254570ED|nr:uncharacterized protein N7516_006724 [Penicillium verrucosum]KAJ5932235.1 hypothetical protein N7516_006724 [Penicillium verrucosum]
MASTTTLSSSQPSTSEPQLNVQYYAPRFCLPHPNTISQFCRDQNNIIFCHSITIVKISPKVAVKFSAYINITEAKTMIYITLGHFRRLNQILYLKITYELYLRDSLSTSIDKDFNTALINAYLKKALKRYIKTFLSGMLPQSHRIVFTYSDLRPQNVIVKDGNMVAIID